MHGLSNGSALLWQVLRDAKQEVHPTLEALSREAGRGGKQQNRSVAGTGGAAK